MSSRLPPHLRARYMQQDTQDQQVSEQINNNPSIQKSQQQPLEQFQDQYIQQQAQTTQNYQQLQQQPIQPNYSAPNPQISQTQPIQQNTIQNVGQQQKQNDQNKKSRKPSQPNKIDTDQIPRPIITREETVDYKVHKTAKGFQSVPQAQNMYTTIDEGNAGPRFIRSSLYSLSQDVSTLNQTQIPTGCVITPMAEVSQQEDPVPLVDCRNSQIFRCTRCKAYVNPNFSFIENGQKAICNLCKMTMNVSNDYYAPLNEYKQRQDKYERPELSKGVYDFLAPKEYKLRDVDKISIMIVLEMTPITVQSGVFSQAFTSLQQILDSIQYPENTQIAIATYDRWLNFYNLPGDLNNDPSLIVVSDLDDPYCPLPINTLFLNVLNDREKINYLIEKLLKNAENMMAETHQKKFIQSAGLGAIIQACLYCMENATGKIIAFSSQLPSQGFGKLKKRDDIKLMNTDQEKQLYMPQTQIYTTMAKQCLEKKIAVDLFIFSPDYTDLATICSLCALTGGSLYHYPQYDPNFDGEKVHYQLFRNFTRQTAYDCVMTFRTSQGIILSEYYTGAGKIQVRDLELSAIDSDKSITRKSNICDILKILRITDQEAYLQYALLYTNQGGQRCVRIINLALSICQSNISQLFRSADVDAVTNIIFRSNIINLPLQPIKTIQQSIINQSVNILHAYRQHCANTSSPGQLILPESLKILALFVNSLFKKEILRTAQNIKPDERMLDYIKISTMTPLHLNNWLYPKVFPIHNIYDTTDQPGEQLNDGKVILPSNIANTIDKLANNGVYLIDEGDMIYVYIQKEVSPDLLLHLFETQELSEVSQMGNLPYLEDVDYSMKVNLIIDQLRKNKMGAYQSVRVVVQGDQMEHVTRKLLIEDNIKGVDTYGDFLCHVHKLIQQKNN